MLGSAALSVTTTVPISSNYGSTTYRASSLALSLPSTRSFQLGNVHFSAHLNFKNGPIRTLKTAVFSVDSDQISSSSNNPPDKQEVNKYHFVVANAKFMLDEEEHFQEQLFERLRLYGERNKERDFWLVIEPKFLDKFPNITKRLRRPAVALVSTNGTWITFMKLRLDRVLSDSFDAGSLEEALASNPATLEFEKSEKWLAPYPKYEFGWWESFLPTATKGTKV